jgi:hypothetical protein
VPCLVIGWEIVRGMCAYVRLEFTDSYTDYST